MNIQARRVADDQRLQAMDERNPACSQSFAGLGIQQKAESPPRLAGDDRDGTRPQSGSGGQTALLHLYLIRHGETEWSLSGRHTGRTDVPLTRNGEDEARELGKQLGAIPFAHVLTSPLKRARQTCELVGVEKAPEMEPDLAEWDYGDYEGQRSVDIRKARPDWNVYQDGCPHGEMPAQIAGRVDRLVARLRKLDGNVALFTHGQVGCVLAARWIGLAVAEARHFSLGTASLSILAFDPHQPDVPVIALWNAAARLGALPNRTNRDPRLS
jgi:broad specificity phosphatase PhoE